MLFPLSQSPWWDVMCDVSNSRQPKNIQKQNQQILTFEKLKPENIFVGKITELLN